MSARGINKVILVGRLGNDPEVRYIPNGGAVANLQVATSESWRDKQTGEGRCRIHGDDGRKIPSCSPAAGGMVTGHDDVPVTQPGGAVVPAQFLHCMQP